MILFFHQKRQVLIYLKHYRCNAVQYGGMNYAIISELHGKGTAFLRFNQMFLTPYGLFKPFSHPHLGVHQN